MGERRYRASTFRAQLEEDWRDVRARLVAREQREGADPTAESVDEASGFVYESPLIEQGTIILGGTQQAFGFALRQQYFHKSVMLLLQHDEGFTKGIILNRPSALEIDGWRVWFGGDVAEGGTFRGGQPEGGETSSHQEITCLHSLQSEEATRLSLPIIRGVYQTSLEGAQALIGSGAAHKGDFWLFVGYAGWAPSQLQGEVERDSWYLAAADSAVLLHEMLRQGTELPPPSAGELAAGDGLSTWEALMLKIGKAEEVERTRDCLEDRMLKQWVRTYLFPRPSPLPLDAARLLPESSVGLVLRAGSHTDRFTLTEQFMHKSLLVLLHETPEVCIGLVLNRVTANAVKLNTPNRPTRRISFGGEAKLRALDADANGLLWLHRRADYGGTPLGDSGLLRMPSIQAAELIRDGSAQLADFLIVAGAVPWERSALLRMINEGDLEVVPRARSLWDGVFSLADSSAEGDKEQLTDGTALWWASTLLTPSQSQESDSQPPYTVQAAPSAKLADEALTNWLKFFAGHEASSAAASDD